MYEDWTDGQAIEASWRHPDMFALVFERHFEVVYRYLVRRIGPSSAEEIAAGTFLEAFRRRHRYDISRANARPWLFGIATNLLRHYYRDEQRRLAAYSRLRSDAGVQPSDDGDLKNRALISEVVRILARLKRRDRDVLLLYAWADLSYQEISEALLLPVGTIRSRLHRIRQQIRELLGVREASY
ncbi:MAG: RNA polymerase sigma factor [Actinomycetota bacterium]